MEGRVICDGIQITPPVIEFRDINAGCIYQTQITVQNIGVSSKRIRFHAPVSERFQLQCKLADKAIAPGLQVSAIVEFHCDREEICSSHFLLLVDDDQFKIPLTAIVSEPGMEVTSDVNFGVITADGKVLRKEIAILNRGSKNGAFKLVYEGKEPISVVPRQGVVKAGYSQPIRFEFTSKKPGVINEKVQLSMEGQPDSVIHVLAEVALKSLQLLSLEDETPVNHINFGSTYFGTDVLHSFLIFNKSPERTSFVVILEEEGEGQEVGVNLSLIKSTALMDIGSAQLKYEEDDLTTLVTAFPSQGTLAPYEKRLLHFKFSPRCTESNQGWSSSEATASRKDYALFLHIDTVGCMSAGGRNFSSSAMKAAKDMGKIHRKKTFTWASNFTYIKVVETSTDSRVEVALTGTALPVLLSILPSPTINFDNCPVGSCLDCKVVVRNDSTELPVEFVMSKCAHFVSFPHSGKLEANGFIDLVISFRPNQVGHFVPKLNLLVQGVVVESCNTISNIPKFKQIDLCKYAMHVEGTSLPVVGQKIAKSLSAQGKLYPQETNENKVEHIQSDFGAYLQVCRSSSNCIIESKSMDSLSARECKNGKGVSARTAKPDDLAMSIRPSNKKENVVSQFTKTKRYTYVDPDYEYNTAEDLKKRENRQKYLDYIHKRRAKKSSIRNGFEINQFPKPRVAGIPMNEERKPVSASSKDVPTGKRLLTSKNLETIHFAASMGEVAEGLKALPTTEEEKMHCSKVLSPLELYQIGLEPKIINFGKVCGKSLASRQLKIVNSLQTYIHVKVEIDCRELRQTSPLSQVLPPQSVAALEFVFEATVFGTFERSVSYSINGHHHGHLVVTAEVVSISLTLSTNTLSLSSSPGLPPDAGMRETVMLYNKHNVPAQFSWTPVVGKEGTAFSVRPARGAVDSNSNLVCEVVFYPSFHAPLSGKFRLNVENGNQLDLDTQAEIAPTSCSFVEHRVMFGAVPLNLVTTRSAFLKNTSQNHAFFKVNDVSPIPGMTVSPSAGVVPVGGSTELRIDYKPFFVQKFDTQIEVVIRGWKSVFLRMGGHVEAPSVDIDIERFQFGGIFCGARSVLPFKLKNMARSRAKVAFNLTEKRDFSVIFGEIPDAKPQIADSNGYFETALLGQQNLQCYLEFLPTEIASYDFIISAVVNETTAPSPPPSPYPASVALSKPGQCIEDSNRASRLPTPSRRIQATALRAPLQISSTEITFDLPSGYFDMGIENAAGRVSGVMFVNNSNTTLTWHLNLETASPYIEDGIFQLLHRSGSAYTLPYNGDHLEFPPITLGSGEMLNLGVLFTPGEAGVYETSIPVILDDDVSHPYRVIRLRGELAAPTIHFEPTAVQFLPAPLRTRVTVEVSIIARGFRRATNIQAVAPKVELEDGSEASVFEIQFPNGNLIEACCQDVAKVDSFVISCRITFESPKPASINTSIKFFTGQLTCFLPVIATADNCLMTSYKFLAVHQADFHIIYDGLNEKETGTVKEKGEFRITSLVPSLSAIKSPTEKSNATESTSFGPQSSTYEESSFSSSTVKSRESDNKDGEDHEETTVAYEYYSTEGTADTDEERFIKDVTRSVQRWFSSQAWSNGPSPILIPYTLRSCFSPGEDNNGTTRAGIWSREKKKESRTVFDMVAHLCGKAIPGIPINGSIPTEPFDRTRYIHWMYTILINFLRCQGAIVAFLRPEYLLDKEDFKRFISIKAENLAKSGANILVDSAEKEVEQYDAVSKRTWTDLLLQIIKVLVLNRVTPQNYRKLNLPANYKPLPPLNVDPFSSNVFSVGEKIILAWLNHHFQEQRNSWLWKASIAGMSPSSRWIVNFDNDFLDGLVLASVLVAYAPFVVPRFLYSMYTHPITAEQCLHNSLKVVDALRYIGIDYDVVATDITEPNPINVLLLCVFLYYRLPNYIPRSTIEFNASLHSVVTKKIKLQNPSSRPIVYQIIITGENSADFSVPSGKLIKVASKSHVNLEVQYKGRFLHSCSAVLILVGKRAGFQVGSTLVFRLTAAIDTIMPLAVYKTETPCYELKTIQIDIKNPFEKAADFKVVLVEVEQQVSNAMHQSKSKGKVKAIKSVPSRTDHGLKQKPQTKSNDVLVESHAAASIEEREPTGVNINAFWCSSKQVSIGTDEKIKLDIEFLPFAPGHFQCSVLLINEEVGDIVLSIEAESNLPLPSWLPFQPSNHVVRMGECSKSEGKDSSFDARTIYWRCNITEEISDDIVIPMINEAREKALVLAAHQRMSEKERCRRDITGSLSAATISKTLKLMGVQEKSLSSSSAAAQKSSSKTGIVKYEVEGSSKYFKIPSWFEMSLVTKKTVDCTAKFPVKFVPDNPGHYQCRIVLNAPTDIRVFHVEVTVNPEASDIELEFTSPTHECVMQNIPVVNNSEQDWTLLAQIDGTGFHGPEKLDCPKYTTVSYALQFQPLYEGVVKGSLTLTNTVNGTETVFLLSGEGRKPLPADYVDLKCQVNEETLYEFDIPNMSNKKMIYQAFCSLDFIAGPESLTVLPRQTGKYVMSVKPWKRGVYDGTISFVCDMSSDASDERQLVSDSEDDDDAGDDVKDGHDGGVDFADNAFLSDSNLNTTIPNKSILPDFGKGKCHFEKPFRIWHSLKITSLPSRPLNTLEVKCTCHSRTTIELLVENPESSKIECDVLIEGEDLIPGEETLSVQSKAAGIYHVDFAPTVIKRSRGSVIFQHPLIGEVWYDLVLISMPPEPKELRMMQCSLGSKCIQMIRVDNPTDELVTYDVICSNTRNFWLDLKNDKVDVLPHSGIEVPLKFSPSALGRGLHEAQVIFKSDELGEFIFNVTGKGVLPTRSDDFVIRSSLSSSASTIITFENPFEEDIVVNVDLSERVSNRPPSYLLNDGNNPSTDMAFTLLLQMPKNILLAPLSRLGIPICFAPESMIRYEAICTVTAMKSDGSSFEANEDRSLFPSGNQMRWIFPVIGIPEFRPIEGKKIPCIECKSKQRVEEQLQLSFTGLTTNSRNRIAYPNVVSSHILRQSSLLPDFGPEYSSLLDDFSYEFEYSDAESHSAIDRSVGINLIHKLVHKVSGVITFVFNLVFSPHKTFSHAVQLVLTSSRGGVWRYPLKFIATEADPDDVIELEAIGLHKNVSVGFRLTSQSDYFVPFWVSLDSNGGQMFSVTPLSGELPPLNSPGQLFKVTYRPKTYGKVNTSKLSIHTPDSQWTYALRGCPPNYYPPLASAKQEKMKKQLRRGNEEP